MHLHTILAFAFLFWWADQGSPRPLVSADDVAVTLGVVLGLPVVIWAAAAWISRRTVRAIDDASRGDPDRAQRVHHWVVFALRLVVLAGFGGAVFLTRWAGWFDWSATHWSLQVLGDLIVLLPYFAAVTALWVGSYPLEARLRRMVRHGEGEAKSWSLGAYLDFNLRHQVFIVAAPMSLILFASNVVKANEGWLKEWTGVFWAPDVALGLVAGVVFLIAPMMLRRIWRTHSLEPGPMRDRLEAICKRIGLRVRDILVWKSDGMVVNAAVMGIVPQIRYVILSDGLLATMHPRQVEAVFGHEAGHVIHRHIQHFLLFAYVGWVLAAGAMELMLKMSAPASTGGGGFAIQGVGLGVIIVLWGLGFGWVSRRFERQADVYGASCVQPDGEECLVPCSIHLGPGEVLSEKDRVCATGAKVFGEALDRVAVLNGIPHEERSWRHSSIASRIRFLHAQAGDPNLAKGFARLVRRVKRGMLASAIALSVAASYYWIYAEPALARFAGGGR